MYVVINELEKDVLREIVNIGLARAADSFADFSHKAVLFAVPEIKIIEPRALPDMIHEYADTYRIIRSEIAGDLSGKTFLLFSEKHIQKIAAVCLPDDVHTPLPYQQMTQALLTTISQIITKALAAELEQLLNVELSTAQSASLQNYQRLPIQSILKELPGHQPFVIAIKTQFQKLSSLVELPLIIVLHSGAVAKLLGIMRRENLYDFKLLQEKA